MYRHLYRHFSDHHSYSLPLNNTYTYTAVTRPSISYGRLRMATKATNAFKPSKAERQRRLSAVKDNIKARRESKTDAQAISVTVEGHQSANVLKKYARISDDDPEHTLYTAFWPAGFICCCKGDKATASDDALGGDISNANDANQEQKKSFQITITDSHVVYTTKQKLLSW